LPDRPDLLYDLALAQYSLGRVSAAEQNMRRALDSPSKFSQTNAARWFLAMAALQSNPAQAVQSESQVLQLLKANPEYVPALIAQAAIAEQRHQFDEARTIYERVLAIYPEFSPAAKRLAVVYAEHLDDDQKAYNFALKARTALPDDPELAKLLGRITYRRKDYSYSAQLLQESSRKLTNDAEVFFYLGMAYHQLEKPNETRQALRRALDLKPESGLAQQAGKVLAELR
jgi:tetratricopeptide (TPR) repeat protein